MTELKKIAIIGGGFTGLRAAISLIDKGFDVTVFEANDKLGGLASGFRPSGWRWPLEIFYHHIFTGDKEIISLSKKIGLPPMFLSPVTTSFIDGKELQLDSPISVLKFKKLSIFSRIRMGLGLAILKIIPNGLFLEKYKVVDILPVLIGKQGYEVIWEKLLRAKFSDYTDRVNMAWFWTRVAKRSQKLGYFKGGFQGLADKMGEYLKAKGGKILLRKSIAKVEKDKTGFKIDDKNYDAVLLTVPTPVIEKLVDKDQVSWPKIDYLWGQTLILELKRKLIKSYWMNILEKNWPFLVAVEHTNMISKNNYGKKTIIYLGNYLPENDKRLVLSDNELLKLYLPYLKKINKNFKKDWVVNIYRFKQPYSQPVFPVNYSQMVPGFRAKSNGMYVANMSMVYPYDRGTNYAVKMGQDVADLIVKDL